MAKVHGQALETALQAWVDNATSVELRYLKDYTPDPDDQYWSDISAYEASGAPTVTAASITVTYDSTNDRVAFDMANPSDSSITSDTNGFAIINNTGTPTTSEILYSDTMTRLQPTDGVLSLTLDANGLFALGTNAT